MTITTSPDISVLDYQVTWDISGVNPKILFENLSSGNDLSAITWWFVVTSPTGTLIHEGSYLSPDISGIWSDYTGSWNWPRPYNNIEFSGAPYECTLFAQDSIGNQYQLTKTAAICRPFGNTSLSKNTYGVASVDVQVKCEQGRVWFQDTTINSYKGITGVQGASNLKVIYPIDETQNIPDPFSINNFSSALVPITYSSPNYQFLASSVYDYDMTDNVFVRIKYQTLKTFAVWCNIDLLPLVCEYTKLIDSVELGSCGDVALANQKLMLINPKFSMLIMGMLQPLTGIDVPKLIEEIIEIGGFNCDCCNAPSGIIPNTASVIDGYSFSIVPGCGDISGTVQTTGTNIQFILSDVTYVFAMYPDSPQDTSAFTIVPSTSGCTKTYYLKVDGTQLATDLLNIIANNATLVNLFNSIVTGVGGGGNSTTLVVDGDCIFSSTSTCNYTFTLSNIPSNTTYALLTSIKIGNINHSLSFSFNLTNLGALQTYLNGLGYGTFIVTNPSGQTVIITSNTNSNDIQGLNYKISGTTFPAASAKNCTGFVPISADQAVQNIINYLCGIDDSQIVTSQDYSVCYVDSNGDKQTETVTAGVALTDFLKELTDKGCQTIDYIQNLSSLTCSNVQALFPASNVLQITATDNLYGSKGGGSCARIGYLDAFNYMLTTGISNATTRGLFCQFVAACGAGQLCSPYNYLDVIYTLYNTTCTDISGIEYTLT